jgi:uncharacterized protein (TIGR02569 family)
MAAPSESVLHAFRVEAVPVQLAGGQGTAWRCGDVVLKPLDMAPLALRWQADLLPTIAANGFRVAAPLRTQSGELIKGGWTAWPFLAGQHTTRWADIVAVGTRFHDALASVPKPPSVLEATPTRWAQADRVAWEEQDAWAIPGVPDVGWLLDSRRPIAMPDQLIHGDLSGNVLFADDQPPAIIDFSPYWRPKRYATAIVLVDAIAWHRADARLLDRFLREPDGAQLLIRAALLRLFSDSNPAAGRYDVLIDTLRQNNHWAL